MGSKVKRIMLIIGTRFCKTLSLLLMISVLASTWSQANATTPHQDWLLQRLAGWPEAPTLHHPQLIRQLYQAAGYARFWHDAAGVPTGAARHLQQQLAPWQLLAPIPALDNVHQLSHWLSDSTRGRSADEAYARDLLITDRFLDWLSDRYRYRWNEFDHDQDQTLLNQANSWGQWPDPFSRSRLEDHLASWTAQLHHSPPTQWIQTTLAETTPPSAYYWPLRQAFARLQQSNATGPWPTLPPLLHQSHQQLDPIYHEILRLQLSRLGDLMEDETVTSPRQRAPLNDRLSHALKRFQKRHQLTPSGQLDEPTRQWLNIPLSERLRRLAHNIRRLEHLPRQLNDHYLMINMADQQLQWVVNGQTRAQTRVIVGSRQHRTPIMAQWLTSLILNPLWNVPPEIARTNIMPLAKRNPTYLAARDYTIVEGWSQPPLSRPLASLPEDAFTPGNPRYRLQQQAGRFNQLGRVKFRLSNRQAIYLHDTPAQSLFNRTQRTLSHGCVRVENAQQLATWLLEDTPEWSAEKLQQQWQTTEERYVQVRPKVAVYLMYWTAFVDAQGILQWREDIYGKDRFETHPIRVASRQ